MGNVFFIYNRSSKMEMFIIIIWRPTYIISDNDEAATWMFSTSSCGKKVFSTFTTHFLWFCLFFVISMSGKHIRMILRKSFAADFVLLYFFPFVFFFSLQVLVSVYCSECVSVGNEVHRAKQKTRTENCSIHSESSISIWTGSGYIVTLTRVSM